MNAYDTSHSLSGLVNHRLSLRTRSDKSNADSHNSLPDVVNNSLVNHCTIFQALSDVDQEDEEAADTRRRSGQEVIVDGNGLVTQCPDLGYYGDRPLGAGRMGGDYGVAPVESPAANDFVVPPPMQVRVCVCL